MPDDDRLLERLGRAFAPPPAEPSAAESRALHRAVARLRSRPARVPAAPEPTTVSPERVIYLPPMVLRPAGAAIGVVPPSLSGPAGS